MDLKKCRVLYVTDKKKKSWVFMTALLSPWYFLTGDLNYGFQKNILLISLSTRQK